MKDVFSYVFQIFRYHQEATITFFIGIAGLSVVALVREVSNVRRTRRARRPPKEDPTAKFGPNSTPPGTRGDEIAQRDRDLEKWREEHKAQLER
jgi:hypothetical protein